MWSPPRPRSPPRRRVVRRLGAAVFLLLPAVPLSLPQLRTRDGAAETIRDLTSHPWAGAKVKITLVARDEAGQEGRSAPAEAVLPARAFYEPLAKAVVEQRTRLALDANAADGVANALDALTLAPRRPSTTPATTSLLASAHHRLVNARDDDALRDVVDYLWTVALGIEDGDLSLAARELRNAQEALREALERGASDDRDREAHRRASARPCRNTSRRSPRRRGRTRRRPAIRRMPTCARCARRTSRRCSTRPHLAENGARDAAEQLQPAPHFRTLRPGGPRRAGRTRPATDCD